MTTNRSRATRSSTGASSGSSLPIAKQAAGLSSIMISAGMPRINWSNTTRIGTTKRSSTACSRTLPAKDSTSTSGRLSIALPARISRSTPRGWLNKEIYFAREKRKYSDAHHALMQEMFPKPPDGPKAVLFGQLTHEHDAVTAELARRDVVAPRGEL